ncbi:HXXEE domain-containing protein [Limosilactobacillus allomucosae]|uniref:HXXEE domain-containing protein n=1 Tax=Limosilactobacillus allomucosae TaxID=3142938 RepID=A0ABV0I4H1_9LACO
MIDNALCYTNHLCGFFFAATFQPTNQHLTHPAIASFMSLLVHQFEEYVIPGGAPIVINRIFYNNQKNYDRYPGNWNSIMIVNVSAYVFYLLAIFYPEWTWLGVATILFNFSQFLGHVIKMNIGMKTWYNPGMGSVVLIMTPISIWYLILEGQRHLLTGMTWLWGILAFVLIVALTVVLPVQGLKNPNSRYPIPKWQLEQFEKVWRFASLKR